MLFLVSCYENGTFLFLSILNEFSFIFLAPYVVVVARASGSILHSLALGDPYTGRWVHRVQLPSAPYRAHGSGTASLHPRALQNAFHEPQNLILNSDSGLQV